MKQWNLICSIDAIDIDYEEIIVSEEKPDVWKCRNIAEDHGCAFWFIEEIK